MKKYIMLILVMLLVGCLENNGMSKTEQQTPYNTTEEAKTRLAKYLGVCPTTVKLITSEQKTWANSSMDCSSIKAHKQVVIEGNLIKFENNGETYNVHQGRNNYILCLTDKAEML